MFVAAIIIYRKWQKSNIIYYWKNKNDQNTEYEE